MPEPLFGAEDRVAPPPTQLPEELRGVTDPVKIASYYQRREAALREEMRRATPPNPNPTRVTVEVPTDDKNKPPTAVTQAETDAARVTLIETAKTQARQGKPYWDRLAADIDQIMSRTSVEDRLNYKTWELAYHSVVGMNMEKLRTEDAAAAAEAARLSAERSAAPAADTTPPAPLPLEVTSKILPGLNISEDQYRTAQTNIAKGVWPLTAENVGGKRVTIGGGK